MKSLKKLGVSILGMFSLIQAKIFGASMSMVYGPPQAYDTPLKPQPEQYNFPLQLIFIFLVPLIFLVGLIAYTVSKVKAKKPVSITIVIILSVIIALSIIIPLSFYFSNYM